MKKVLKIVGGIVIGVGVIVGGYILIFTDALVTAKYNNTVGVKVEDSKRNRYEHSASYVEGKAQELAKVREELSRKEDIASRKALIDMIRANCANLDINDLNDMSLKLFLEQIRNGQIQ